MRTTTINCDTCNADLTDSGPRPTYYLTLNSVKMANRSGAEFAIMVHPPTKGQMDFCSKACLAKWVNPSN
jgi:hypothetical protein